MPTKMDDNVFNAKPEIGPIQDWERVTEFTKNKTKECSDTSTKTRLNPIPKRKLKANQFTRKTKQTAPTLAKTEAKPVSERKRAANRKNAQRSTGPKTETGKSRSRGNAIKHGLFVQELALQRWLSVEDFNTVKRLFQKLVDHFLPVGPVEELYVEIITDCYWKMRRLKIAENASIKMAIDHRERISSITGRKNRYLSILRAFGDAATNAEALGYVDDDHVKTIVEQCCDNGLKNAFLLANQKVRDLATERDDGSNLSGHETMKKAQSALRRSLDALRDNCFEMEESMQGCEERQQEPYFEDCLLPEPMVVDNLLRYQTATDRRLSRTMADRERSAGASDRLRPKPLSSPCNFQWLGSY